VAFNAPNGAEIKSNTNQASGPFNECRAGNARAAQITLRIVPFVMLLYFIAFVDRVNIGFAALTMNKDLGFSPTVFGFGAGIFFLGYFLFEVPSNLVLDKVGARIWIARVMITWGLISGAMAFVQGSTSFYTLRFLLGAAEAGFFPGIILYGHHKSSRNSAFRHCKSVSSMRRRESSPSSRWSFGRDIRIAAVSALGTWLVRACSRPSAWSWPVLPAPCSPFCWR
jgi:MFS family permease